MEHLIGAPTENHGDSDDESSASTSFLTQSSLNDGPDGVGSI